MNIYKKQEVKSSSILVLLGLLGLCGIIIFTPWNRHMQDSQVGLAVQKAEVVGYQVIQIYNESLKGSQSKSEKSARVPASVDSSAAFQAGSIRSVGTMGQDPWGEPFHYRLLASDKPGYVRILVWSTGPNLRVESAQLEDEEKSIEGQPVYGGDDLGVTLTVNH